jgi:hypothetical protein
VPQTNIKLGICPDSWTLIYRARCISGGVPDWTKPTTNPGSTSSVSRDPPNMYKLMSDGTLMAHRVDEFSRRSNENRGWSLPECTTLSVCATIHLDNGACCQPHSLSLCARCSPLRRAVAIDRHR